MIEVPRLVDINRNVEIDPRCQGEQEVGEKRTCRPPTDDGDARALREDGPLTSSMGLRSIAHRLDWASVGTVCVDGGAGTVWAASDIRRTDARDIGCMRTGTRPGSGSYPSSLPTR